jgi:SNF2 family DNA or RNA helicase
MKLFEHQKEALLKTENQNRVAYYYDMGLGKTFIGSEKVKALGSKTTLVICQKSKVEDWVEHFRTNYPEFRTFDLTNDKTLKIFLEGNWKRNEGRPADPMIGVINYDLVFRRNLDELRDFTLMLDESQLIQNETAKRTKYVLKMTPSNVVLLSGTPTSGKYEKLWTQLHLLGWEISKDAYFRSYVETEWIEDGSTGFKREVVVGYKNTDRLRRKLADHGAIFMKTEEAFDLPEQTEINLYVKPTKEYFEFMKESIVTTKDGIELVGDCILTKMLYARQLCGQYNEDKLQAFQDLIESTEERIIVFYNFYEELYAMYTVIGDRPRSVVNGQFKDLHAYEDEDNSITFVQYQSGAMGLNLQKAHITVYYTLPFGKGSCALWEQSKKRTHRIGQNNNCLYYYLLARKTIEERNLDNLRIGKEYNDYLFEADFGQT